MRLLYGVDVGATKLAVVGVDREGEPRFIQERTICPKIGNQHEKRMARCRNAFWFGQQIAFMSPLSVLIENPMGGYPLITAEQNRVMGAFIAGLDGAVTNLASPPEWKKAATGRGNATKAEVRETIYGRHPMVTAWSQDLCDAYAIALAALEMGLVVS